MMTSSWLWVAWMLAAPPSDPLTAIQAGGSMMTEAQAVDEALARAPGVKRREALVAGASASIRRTRVGLAPLVTLEASATALGFPDPDPLVPAVSDADAAGLRAGVAAVQDPAAQGVLDALVEGQLGVAGTVVQLPDSQVSFSMELVYPLTSTLFRVLPALRALEYQRDARAAEALHTKVTVAWQVRQVYLAHARTRALAVVAREAVTRAQARLQEVDVRLRAGAGLPVERALWRSRLAEARMGVARASRGEAESWAALSTLTGRPLDGRPALRVPTPVRPAGDASEWVSDAFERRPDLSALSRSRAALKSQRQVVLAEAYPELLLLGRVAASNPVSGVVPPPDQFGFEWRAGVALQWTPNQLATALSARDEVDEQIRALDHARDELKDGIRIGVRQAWVGLNTSLAVVEESEAAVAAARAVLELRVKQRSEGAGRPVDVVDADTGLTQALVARVDAYLDAALATARLDYAAGRLR